MELEEVLNEIGRLAKKNEQYKREMCTNPYLNITYCSDYNTDKCPRTCNYIKEREKENGRDKTTQ